MNKGAINYIIRLLVQRVLGLLLFMLGAWWKLGFRAVIYYTLYLVTAIVLGIVMYMVDPETLHQRGKINTDSPMWDKVLLGIFWLLAYFVINLIAGLEAGEAPQLGTLFWIGIALQIPSAVLTLRALMVNTFLESTARVQKDRGQIVCKDGPYSIVRHPTYSALLIWCISLPMVFETLFVMLTAVIIAIIIVIRTYLEDTMLKTGLNGYEEYTHKVKYRLVPFIW